jgi:hypothetical protein
VRGGPLNPGQGFSPCFSLKQGGAADLCARPRYNTFDSNCFRKRFDVRPPKYHRKLISLIMGITGDESEPASPPKTSRFSSK